MTSAHVPAETFPAHVPAETSPARVRAETAGEQIGRILIATERVLRSERPDAVLILGDTNSALAAISDEIKQWGRCSLETYSPDQRILPMDPGARIMGTALKSTRVGCIYPGGAMPRKRVVSAGFPCLHDSAPA